MSQSRTSELDTADLVRAAATDTTELLRLEIALAKDELRQDLVAIKASAIFGAAALVLVLLGVVSLAVAIVLAIGARAGLAVGGGFLVAAGIAAFVATRRLPGTFLSATTDRLEIDGRKLKEHLT